MDEEKILRLHPQEGKQGINISRAGYQMPRQAIIDAIHSQGTITLKG